MSIARASRETVVPSSVITPRRGVGAALGALLRRALVGAAGREGALGVESLEARALLANDPLPTLAQLERPTNTVVRMETNQGDVDIELFNTEAPITVANFLTYVRSGRFDETFFHRRSNPATDGVTVLQGGGFSYSNSAGVTIVPTDAPIVRETTGRSNVERTIAMARTNVINSATNQFYFNLTSNTNLDPTGPNNGFTVFGRVIQGWDIIQAIGALTRRDLSTDPALSELGATVRTVPVTSAYNQTTGVRENALVTITNMEVLKPTEIAGFFSQRLVSPEGFRSASTEETVEIVNPNGQEARYQLIARYSIGGADDNFESGGRDQVIASGSIPAGGRVRVAVTSTGTGTDLTRNGAYALVLETALREDVGTALPLGATITRSDFGAVTSEAFFDVDRLTNADQRNWAIPRIERNAFSQEFVLLYNNSDQVNEVTVTFITSLGQQTITRSIKPYTRSGIDTAGFGLGEGIMSARVTSTQPVLVSVSDWDLPVSTPPAGQPDAYTPGTLVNAVPNNGSIAGALAGIDLEGDGSAEVSLFAAGLNSATVTVRAYGNSGILGTTTVLVLAGQRSVLDEAALAALRGPTDEPFSLIFDAGTVPIAAQFTRIPPADRGLSTSTRSDAEATTFERGVPSRALFAGTLLTSARTPASGVPAGVDEVLSIFNPLGGGRQMTYTVRFLFSDGTAIDGATGTLGAKGRVDIRTGTISAVAAKIRALAGTSTTYSIEVSGQADLGIGPQAFAGVTSLRGQDNRTRGAAPGLALMTGPVPGVQELAISSPLVTDGTPDD